MVGADYWYMPTLPTHNAYGAMVSMSLPWLNPRHGDEVKAAERAAPPSAARSEPKRLRRAFQLRDADVKRARRARDAGAHSRARARRRAAQLRVGAGASFRAAKATSTPVLDAARNYLQVRIDEVRAVAELETSRADYERAAGLPGAGLTVTSVGEER